MRKHGTIATLTLAAAMMVLPAMALTPQPNPAPAASPSPIPQERGQAGSNMNMVQIERHLNNVINQLSHDQRDYGGHKAAAMRLLQQAQQQLNQAEKYAAAHGY